MLGFRHILSVPNVQKQASTGEGRWLPTNSLNVMIHSSSCAVQSGKLRLRKMVKGVPCQVRGLTTAVGYALWISYGLMWCVSWKVIKKLGSVNISKIDMCVCVLANTCIMNCFACGFMWIYEMWIHVDICGCTWKHGMPLMWIPCGILCPLLGIPPCLKTSWQGSWPKFCLEGPNWLSKNTDLVAAFKNDCLAALACSKWLEAHQKVLCCSVGSNPPSYGKIDLWY